MNHVGHHMMLLEKNGKTNGDEKKVGETNNERRGEATDKHDPLTGRIQLQPISIHNKYNLLTDENGYDSDNECDTQQ